jgi:hypothetical protein
MSPQFDLLKFVDSSAAIVASPIANVTFGQRPDGLEIVPSKSTLTPPGGGTGGGGGGGGGGVGAGGFGVGTGAGGAGGALSCATV